ncbi:hypothetical protein [Catelliglobosispora koreensis]|uniref:hypothetical protein n=1 Tax=Catelliglobosispora koreensis TaxID=129052 RepID=UPI0006887865|nr:hypothetical protein [Catelliglobosispora koreensis]
MSYTTPPPSGYLVPEPAGKPARPGTVTMASLLLYLLGALSLVSVGLGAYSASLLTPEKAEAAYKAAGMSATDAEAAAGFASVGGYIGAGFSLLFAILYFVLAVFVGKGAQWARITAWIVGGLAICCGVIGLASQALTNSLSGMGGQAGVDQEKLVRELEALQPSWLGSVTMVLGVISLLAALGVVILLALPPSHPFFRKAEPVWTPPPTFPSA